MELFINNKSGVPIYDQIYSQIKQQIISGAGVDEEVSEDLIQRKAADGGINEKRKDMSYENSN